MSYLYSYCFELDLIAFAYDHTPNKNPKSIQEEWHRVHIRYTYMTILEESIHQRADN